MTTVREHTRSKPYEKLKARMNAQLAFEVMLVKLAKDIDRVLERDALKGWPEEQAARLEQTY
jgi:hypothetical protein